jgi:hypothetical protein
MPTKPKAEQHAAQESQDGGQLSAAIGQHVLRALGPPCDLQRVDVRWLWEGRYRVNVFVGVAAESARIAHSYFLVADGDGNIVESTPKIIREH